MELDDDVTTSGQNLGYAAFSTELSDLKDATVDALEQRQVVAYAAGAAKLRQRRHVLRTMTTLLLRSTLVIVGMVVESRARPLVVGPE